MKYNFYSLEEAIAISDLPELQSEIAFDHLTYSVLQDTLNMLNHMYTICGIDKSDTDLGREALRLILWSEEYKKITDVIIHDTIHFQEDDYKPLRYEIPEE